MANTNLDTFIDNLISERGFDTMTAEMRGRLSRDLKRKFDEFILARSLAQLSEEEIQQFKQMLTEKKSRAELQKFTIDHITDYSTFLDDTLINFREAYLS